jgi:hypothetical protein
MRFFTPHTLLLVLATTSLAIPLSQSKKSTVETHTMEVNASSNNSSSNSSSTSTAAPCSPAVMALAAGIQDNIADQNNELNTATAMASILSQDPVDSTLFGASQSSLMGFVTKGIAIRQNNQKIAPAGNAALAGLATVAMAQMAELNLTMSLGMGGVNVARDKATVETLKADFAGGIMQNKKNLAAVSDQKRWHCVSLLTRQLGYGKLHSSSGLKSGGDS